MLQDIRDNAQGTIAKIIIAVLIVSLSIWGMDAIIGGFSGEPEVATVNGEDITEREYLRMVQIVSQQRLREMERPDPTLLDEDRIRREVLESMIQAEVLAQDAGNQGLVLSDAGVDQLIVGMPQFQAGGEFSQQRFTSFVSNLGMTVIEFRELLRRDYVSNQIQEAVVRGGVAPSQAAQQILAIQQQTREFQARTLEGASVADQVKVTDEQVAAWYQDNTSRFMQPETVDVEYLELTLDSLTDQVDVSEEDLRARYDEMIGQMEQEEERQSAHILINNGDNAEERVAMIQERLAEGADFAELAAEHSDDPLSAEQGGNLGFLREGDLGGAYDEALFSMAEGEVSGPVATDYGTHFIKLLAVRSAEPPAFDEVAPELRQELARDLAADEFARQRTELADVAFSSEDLEYPAEQFDLQAQTRAGVAREGNQAPFDHAGLVRQLFSSDVLEDGFNTELIDVAENTAIVARVVGHHPAAPRPLEEVASDIRERLEREQTLALLRTEADSLLDRLRSGDATPDDDWTRYEGATRSESEAPAAVQAEAFALPRPEQDGMRFGVVEVGSDLVIVALSGVTDGDIDPESEDVRQMSLFLAQMNGQQEYQAYVQTLRDRAEVERP